MTSALISSINRSARAEAAFPEPGRERVVVVASGIERLADGILPIERPPHLVLGDEVLPDLLAARQFEGGVRHHHDEQALVEALGAVDPPEELKLPLAPAGNRRTGARRR
jgi:hypothetical protein